MTRSLKALLNIFLLISMPVWILPLAVYGMLKEGHFFNIVTGKENFYS